MFICPIHAYKSSNERPLVAQHLQNYEISFCKQILKEGQSVATVNVSFWSHLVELIINFNCESFVHSNIKLLIELSSYMHHFGVCRDGCRLRGVASWCIRCDQTMPNDRPSDAARTCLKDAAAQGKGVSRQSVTDDQKQINALQICNRYAVPTSVFGVLFLLVPNIF